MRPVCLILHKGIKDTMCDSTTLLCKQKYCMIYLQFNIVHWYSCQNYCKVFSRKYHFKTLSFFYLPQWWSSSAHFNESKMSICLFLGKVLKKFQRTRKPTYSCHHTKWYDTIKLYIFITFTFIHFHFPLLCTLPFFKWWLFWRGVLLSCYQLSGSYLVIEYV